VESTATSASEERRAMVKKEYQRSGIRDQEDWRGLRIRHSGLAAHPEVKGSYRGWPRMLEWLQAFFGAR